MIIDPSGRGPTMRQLLVAGVAGMLVFALALVLLTMRYQGDFTDKVEVTANLTTTGDGLPRHADVKFRGVLVGAVQSSGIASVGETQPVRIAMKPQYAGEIPNTVTARVVPSNVFAVSAVELVNTSSMPSARGLRNGDQIAQDTSDDTVQLQTTLTTVRSVLDKIDPARLGRVLGTLSEALDGKGRLPGSTVERLDKWIVAMRAAIPDFGADMDRFAKATSALNKSAPQLVDALSTSVKAAATVANKRAALLELLDGSSTTVDTVNALFAANPNAGKELAAGLNNTFGALAADPGAVPATIANLDEALRKLDPTFRWGASGQQIWHAGVSFQPFKPYARPDCPRYGDLPGPSCYTAPPAGDLGVLPPQLWPRAVDAATPGGPR